MIQVSLTLGIGNLIGPQVFQSKDAPQYRPAEITIIVCWALSLILLIVIRQLNIWRNKKNAKLTSASDYVKVQNGEFLDLTDCENPGMSTSITI
jgi:ACS family allantoate permease-like MFS transporter